MKIDPVLNEYRRGYADKRIGMGLYHREFRDGFSCIEQDDPMDFGTSRQSPPPHRLVSTILQVLHNTKRYFFSSHNHTNRSV